MEFSMPGFGADGKPLLSGSGTAIGFDSRSRSGSYASINDSLAGSEISGSRSYSGSMDSFQLLREDVLTAHEDMRTRLMAVEAAMGGLNRVVQAAQEGDLKPRAVILYEGSNDINAGTKPDAVLANFRKFYGKLHAALPQARLYVLGVVPSPGKRFEKIADLRKANELIAKECATQPWMKFIDVTEPLIGANGKPREELFIPGNIHMLPAGYVVWKSVIAPVIVPAEKPFEHVK
jgi:hypothetical protein